MEWSKDGGELPDIERMIVEGRELTITTLNKTDNGTYRCEASNHLGSSSAEYILFVYGGYFSKGFFCYALLFPFVAAYKALQAVVFKLKGRWCSSQKYKPSPCQKSESQLVTVTVENNLF